MKYGYWALLWPLMMAIGIFGRVCAPVVCLFISPKIRFDVVKRFGKQRVAMPRDSLVWWLTWFDTDDNATDEYWYGMYGSTANKMQNYYNTHAIYRWYCRLRWLNRNSMYTFNRKFFGLSKGSPLAWQYKADVALWFGYYNSINIGFKAHKGFDRLLYAGRILGIRKHK